MSYRRQGPFEQAVKLKHSAKNVFMCEGQFAHVT